METKLFRNTVRESTTLRVSALALSGGLVLAACGGGETERTSVETPQSGAPTPQTAAPFKAVQDWSLPKREQLSPVVMTPELCDSFWQDLDGKRRPPVQKDPLIIRVDGRCNTPLESDFVGIYFSPVQQGKAPIIVRNGDSLGVECYIAEQSQTIQDIRGPRSASEVWLGVVTVDKQLGLIPETNAGYVDESKLRTC